MKATPRFTFLIEMLLVSIIAYIYYNLPEYSHLAFGAMTGFVVMLSLVRWVLHVDYLQLRKDCQVMDP